ncbi:hypothetical protein GCM10020295_28190 [Streptomyces cinereospinus]
MTSPTKAEGSGSTVALDPEPASTAEAAKPKELVGRSPGQLMWIRFKRDRAGVVSACVVVFFFLIGLLAPVISKLYGKDPYTVYADERPELFDSAGVPLMPNGGISAEFWFGLEPGNGYDVFTKLIYGIRNSLGISLAVTVATVLTGIVLGVAAGYLGGKVDFVVSRLVDFLLAFPAQLFFIASMPVVVSLFVDPKDETPVYVRVVALIAVQWFLGWMSLARILRGTTLALAGRGVHRGRQGQRGLPLADHPQGGPAQRGHPDPGAVHVHAARVRDGRGRPVLPRCGHRRTDAGLGTDVLQGLHGAGDAERHHLHVLPGYLHDHLHRGVQPARGLGQGRLRSQDGALTAGYGHPRPNRRG